MATKQTSSQASQTYGNSGNSSTGGGRNMGTDGSDSDSKYISFLVLMTLLWFLVLPFELYLYIKVNQHTNICTKQENT
jgi:hypothetical protein